MIENKERKKALDIKEEKLENSPKSYDLMEDLKDEVLTSIMESNNDQDNKKQNDTDGVFHIKRFEEYTESETSDSDEEPLDRIIKRRQTHQPKGYTFSSQNSDDCMFRREFAKSYTSDIVEEMPVENIKSLFKESMLEFEKQKFHQNIFEQVVETKGKMKLKHLQAKYIDALRAAANIEVFTCCLCSYQTMNLSNLNCHLMLSHNGKMEFEIFKCNKCNYESNFLSYISRHVDTTHKKKVYKETSKVVKKTNKDEPVLKEKYPCSECNYKGRSEEGLKSHMSTHKDKTKCDLCPFKSEEKNALKEHKDTHKSGNWFACYECDYKNGNKLTVALHLKKKHNIDTEMSKRSKICEICSFAATDRYKLQQHYMSHKTVKDLKEDDIFKCPEVGCSYQTKLKAHLAAHVRIHKPPEFVCDVCGFATTRKQNYKYHLETHKKLSEIEWLPCSICPYQARTKRHLYQHMKIGAHDGKNRRHIRARNLLAEGLPLPPPRGARKKRIKDECAESEQPKPKPKRKRKAKAKKTVEPTLDELVNFDQLANAFLAPRN